MAGRSSARQSGAISILTAFTLTLLIACLALAIDTGRLYLEQRKLQKIADLAALEAVARLPGVCADYLEEAHNFAADNAGRNNFDGNLTVQCESFDTQSGVRIRKFDPQGNAVWVTATHRVPSGLFLRAGSLFSSSLPDRINLTANAAAEKSDPAAVFTVGAQLLQLNSDALPGIVLKTLGLNAEQLTVLDSQGIASTHISPAGLLESLGMQVSIPHLSALTPRELVALVDTEVGPLPLSRIVALLADAADDSTLALDLGELADGINGNSILALQSIPLLGLAPSPSLIRLTDNPGGTAAAILHAQVSLADLLATTLVAGAQGRALQIPELDAIGGAQVQLGIVEPPAIGVGPVGTKAYGAQIRAYVTIDTNDLLGGLLAWLTDTVLGTRVYLPLSIDLVAAEGTLEHIHCAADESTVDVRIESHLLGFCLGDVPEAEKWSHRNSCDSVNTDSTVLSLLHLPVLSTPVGGVTMAALKDQQIFEQVPAPGTVHPEPNSFILDNTVDSLVSGLLDILSGFFRTPATSFSNQLIHAPAAQQQLIADLSKQYLESTKVNGFYNVSQVTDLVLHGSIERDAAGNQLIPPLVDEDWNIPNSIPRSCLLTVCPPSSWSDGTFSEAFQAYTAPGGLLDLLGVSTLGNGYLACGGLLSSLLNWNNCIQHNLNRLLQQKPGGVNLSQTQDGSSIANPHTDTVSCSGFLCLMLKPALELLKPILKGVGALLHYLMNDILGLELGRVELKVESVSCDIPRLVY